MHGEREGVYMEGVECVHGEREGVYMEGVECACMGRGRVCICMGGVCVRGRGEGGWCMVECVCMGRGRMYVYGSIVYVFYSS